MRITLALAAILLATGTSEGARAAPATIELRADQLILFDLVFDGRTIAESIPAYGDIGDPLLPVAELSRQLGLALEVRPAEGIVTGSIGESQRSLTIDLRSKEGRSGQTGVTIGPLDAGKSLSDIYVRTSLLAKLLPIDLTTDVDNLVIRIVAKERLPVQARKDRAIRLRGLGPSVAADENTLTLESPYGWLSPPAFDVSGEIGYDHKRGGMTTRAEVRVAGDLLNATAIGFFATDEHGNPNSARLRLERKSGVGDLLGPLAATYAGVGDVFLPALSLGPRNMQGTGIFISSVPLENTSVFESINLRGELPQGWDVELYINDILRSGRTNSVQGQYEFLDVPLVRGVNVVRVVRFGPRGERIEESRIYNVSAGQVPKGKLTFDAGIVRQDRTWLGFNEDLKGGGGSLAAGKLRALFSTAYGISSKLTVQASGSVFTSPDGLENRIFSGGFRTSFGRIAFQLDHAEEQDGGSATSLGFAGHALGISLVGRHNEYRGRFIDENVFHYAADANLQRFSDLSFDLTVPFLSGKRLPVSGRIERTELDNGAITWIGRARTTIDAANTLLAFGTNLVSSSGSVTEGSYLSFQASASRILGYKWQLRAGAEVDAMPALRLRTMTFTADRGLSDENSLRLGLTRAFGKTSDWLMQAAISKRLSFGGISLGGEYATARRDFRVGLRFDFGLLFDPHRRALKMTPPGPSSGGSASLRAFRDDNANHRFDPGETPISGIVLGTGISSKATDASGNALLTGLGDSSNSFLRIDASGASDALAVTAPQLINFPVRPGKVVVVDYPVIARSEVIVRVALRKDDGSLTPISMVRFNIVPDIGPAMQGSTEFDGVAVISDVVPGRYKLELEPEQSRQLGMRLSKPVWFDVKSDGNPLMTNAEVALASGHQR